MTQDRSVDERISAWLLGEAPDQLPDRVLQATFERTRPSRQRRAFLGWRSPMIRITPTAIAVGAAAILVIAIGVALLPRSNQPVVGGPVPSPSRSPVPAPTTEPTASLGPLSLTGQIAFKRTVSGNADIYLMNLDGTGLVRLTDDPAFDWQPTWSPDGRTLFFTRRIALSPESADLYALDIATGTETRLTDLPGVEGGPHVSPDGTKIAYEQWPSDPGIHVMDIDGSNPRNLFTPPDDTYSLQGWTGDGTGLYLDRSGRDILRLDVATGEVSTVVTEGDRSALSISPDGGTFAFHTHQSPGGISLMDADGSDIRHIAGSWIDGGPISWSPDGTHLAFAHPDGWLYVVRADGSELTRWTEATTETAWRPGS
jgi:Tol biopolymer transport system component